MPAMQCPCPKCQQVLQVAQALPAQVECPRCKARFVVQDPTKKDKAGLIQKDRDAVRRAAGDPTKKDKASLIQKDRDAVRRAAGNLASPVPVGTMRPAPAPMVVPSAVVSADAYRRRKSGGGLGILIACVLALLIIGGVIVALVMNRGPKKAAEEEPAPVAEVPALNPQQQKIDNAVARGVNYLRNEVLNPTEKAYYFTDPRAGSNVGVLALAGLTLLECGLPSTDAAVEKVIKTVRDEAPRLTFTYSVALCILFLDRLNQATDRIPEPAYRELIQRLAVQMMAAQNANGGWGYTCPALTLAEQEKYQADLKANRFQPGTFAGAYDDNSINQFASLALWAARKQGIKTEPALAMLERRYKQNQNEDGSWGYRARDNGYLKDATTCAGLIGLAVGQGIRDNAPGAKGEASAAQDPMKDPHIARALDFIAKGIGKDPRRMNAKDREARQKHTAEMLALNKQWQESPDSEHPTIMRQIQELDKAPLLKGTYFNADSWGDLYFLWSVERVGVVFDLKKIGGKDWYAWGVDIILPNQKPDGSWRDRFPGIPDTCFALLFLKRANIAKDLTDKFRLVAGGLSIGAAPDRSGQIPPAPARRKE